MEARPNNLSPDSGNDGFMRMSATNFEGGRDGEG
jgi:hypothetical protein